MLSLLDVTIQYSLPNSRGSGVGRLLGIPDLTLKIFMRELSFFRPGCPKYRYSRLDFLSSKNQCDFLVILPGVSASDPNVLKLIVRRRIKMQSKSSGTRIFLVKFATMAKVISAIIIILIIYVFIVYPKLNNPEKFEPNATAGDIIVNQPRLNSLNPKVTFNLPGDSFIILEKSHVFQTFNNCGPATLSMILSYWGINKSQQELGEKLRPYQNPQGDNDDKSVTFEEFLDEAESYGLAGFIRPNGDIEKLKVFIANGLPVAVKTFLHDYDDIGHYRIIRGFDENKKILVQDDSFEGKGLEFSYDKLLRLWQPFNYQYMIIVSKDKQGLAEAILGEELDEGRSWENSLNRAEAETETNNPYPVFNRSVANYYLGNFEESVIFFEEIRNKLPSRMLWYQYEPILAYQKLKDNSKILRLTGEILNNHNRAFSELYIIRGEVMLEEGKKDQAKSEFEKAILYNKNSKSAKDALLKI